MLFILRTWKFDIWYYFSTWEIIHWLKSDIFTAIWYTVTLFLAIVHFLTVCQETLFICHHSYHLGYTLESIDWDLQITNYFSIFSSSYRQYCMLSQNVCNFRSCDNTQFFTYINVCLIFPHDKWITSSHSLVWVPREIARISSPYHWWYTQENTVWTN